MSPSSFPSLNRFLLPIWSLDRCHHCGSRASAGRHWRSPAWPEASPPWLTSSRGCWLIPERLKVENIGDIVRRSVTLVAAWQKTRVDLSRSRNLPPVERFPSSPFPQADLHGQPCRLWLEKERERGGGRWGRRIPTMAPAGHGQLTVAVVSSGGGDAKGSLIGRIMGGDDVLSWCCRR